MRYFLKILRSIGVGLGWAVLAFLAIGISFSYCPVADDWPQPQQPKDVLIYINHNGYHTGFWMPMQQGGLDWRQHIDLAHVHPPASTQWVGAGWGDRGYYEAFLPGRSVDVGTVAYALFWPSPSILHVQFSDSVPTHEPLQALRISQAQYQQLVRYICRSTTDADCLGSNPEAGYGAADYFISCPQRYHALRTCNQWTSEALRSAGIPSSYWAPFSGNVLYPLQP